MQTREQKIEKLTQLVNKFTKFINDYKKPSYNESDLRLEFLNPFFELLDWDVRNEENSHINYKDVVVEERINVYGSDNKKAPDYTFRIGGTKKFFVEAKKPSVDIKDAFEPAFQLKRYGHSAGLCLSILTDFEELSVYDTRKKPNKKDKPTKDRIFYYKYTDYIEKFDEIYNLFSKTAIKQGSFEQFEKDDKHRKGNESIDEGILDLVDNFREILAKNIVKNNENVDVPTLNKAVIKIIDRLFFLRIAEDKEVEPYKTLFNITNQPDIYDNLKKIFKEAKTRYNSELFEYFKNIDELVIDDKILKEIITNLYTPECVYEFSQIPVSILGSMYEQFLGKTIRITDGGHVKIEEKPEVKKAGGVYYTPEYIVNYIVKNTVGEKVKDLTPKEIEKIKILDPACGSGSFLIGAYQYLIDYHINYYTQEKQIEKSLKNQLIAKTKDGYILSIPEKQKILLNNIFGVDIDQQAVEVAKFSLLLKLMESEDKDTQIKELFKEGQMYLAVLPNLKNNIKCGNSLIGTDYYKTINMELLGKDDDNKINAFDWDKEFPEIFKSGGFDCVIGNPPYVRNRDLDIKQKKYFDNIYVSTNGQYDLYQLFYEKSVNILGDKKILGFITSNKFTIASYGKKLREFILEQCRINQIVDVSNINVFAKASTYPYIFFLEKNKDTTNNVIKYKKVYSSLELLNKEFKYMPQDSFSADINKNFIIKEIPQFFAKIEKISDKLGDIATIKETIHTGNIREKLITDNYENKLCKKLLAGKDVHRYNLKWMGRYIKYDKSLINKANKEYANLCNEKYFENPKILMREIAFNIECVFDDEKYYTLNKLYSIQLFPNVKYSYLFLLGILNSKILSFYFRIMFEEAHVGGNYLQFKKIYTSQIPIKKMNLSNDVDKKQHDKIVELVSQMLEIQKQLHSAKTESDKQFYQKKSDIIDKQIDTLVYELYELTTEEIKIIEGK